MFIYVSRDFTVTLPGARIKHVQCEKCATEFDYQLSRIGAGKGSAPYFLFQEAAKRRAQKRAQKQLDRRLEKEVELVPCPSCRWINQTAIAQFRKTKYLGFKWVSVLVLLLAAGLDLLFYFDARDTFGHAPSLLAPEVWMLASAALVIIALSFSVQFLLRTRIDPNKTTDGIPRVPDGTPPALLKGAAEGTFTPVPSEFSNLQTDATWATFRVGQLQLESLCCACLEPATCIYKLPITCEKPIPVPLCRPCLRRIRTKWVLQNLVAILLATAISWILSRHPGHIDEVGRTMMWVFVAGFGALVGLLIVDKTVRPYRLRSLDKSRGVWKISFRNPAYTAIMIRKIGQSDGLYPHANVAAR